MRIVVEADSIAADKISGVGHVTLELLNELDQRIQQGQKLMVVAVIPYEKRAFVKNFAFKRIKIRTLPPGYRYVNYALTRLPIWLPVDLWFGIGLYVFPNYKNWSVPFSRSVTFVHDMAYKKYPDTMNDKNLVYLETNMLRWLKQTTTIMTISNSSAQDIAHYFPDQAAKIEVAYPGVNPELYRPLSKDQCQATIDEYGLPAKYLLFVGNVEPRKNLLKLLEAYEQLPKKLRDTYGLVIIGADGWKNEKVLQRIKRDQAKGLQIVRPTKYVPDEAMPYIYNQAAILVHPAVYEGFGMTPLEAMACGTPVLTGSNSSLLEVVGKTAMTFDENDAADIANKISLILNDAKLAQQLSIKGIKRAQQFSWSQTVDKVLAAGLVN